MKAANSGWARVDGTRWAAFNLKTSPYFTALAPLCCSTVLHVLSAA
jgi:hypothetical protein